MIRFQCTTPEAQTLAPDAWQDWPAASSPPTLDEIAAQAMAYAHERSITSDPGEPLAVCVYYYDSKRDPVHPSGAPLAVHGHTCTLWPHYAAPKNPPQQRQELAEL